MLRRMRTTVDIDEDVLMAAKSISAQKDSTLGKVISDLVQQALAPKRPPSMRSGVPVFPQRKNAKIVTMDLVNRLRDERE